MTADEVDASVDRSLRRALEVLGDSAGPPRAFEELSMTSSSVLPQRGQPLLAALRRSAEPIVLTVIAVAAIATGLFVWSQLGSSEGSRLVTSAQPSSDEGGTGTAEGDLPDPGAPAELSVVVVDAVDDDAMVDQAVTALENQGMTAVAKRAVTIPSPRTFVYYQAGKSAEAVTIAGALELPTLRVIAPAPENVWSFVVDGGEVAEFDLFVFLGEDRLVGTTPAVPDVVGLPLVTATEIVNSMGLSLETIEEPSETVDLGSVVATDPKAGDQITRGEIVTLTVSSGAQTFEPEEGQGPSAGDGICNTDTDGDGVYDLLNIYDYDQVIEVDPDCRQVPVDSYPTVNEDGSPGDE